ncbi:MAG: RidA family protein [Gammaproteobacteria bacterium]|nr:RidA family protein [Gammaproteobacteria bacterium]
MANKEAIKTASAPEAIGPYSQAIKSGSLVFLSGQIPLIPQTMEIVEGDIAAQAHQVFKNLKEVTNAAGGDLGDIVKLTIFMTKLKNFEIVNEIMKRYFQEPFPARATIEVSALPKAVSIEIEAIMAL